jgi:hypothetical protein
LALTTSFTSTLQQPLPFLAAAAAAAAAAAGLRQLGFDYVFDTDFAADLTIMEEGTELLHRLKRAWGLEQGEGEWQGFSRPETILRQGFSGYHE